MQDHLNKDATSGSKPVFASRSLKCSRIAWCYINVCLCLNMSQQWCAGILDFNNKKTASWSRKVIHLYLVLIRSHLEYCSEFWSPVQDAVKQMWLQNSQGWSTCAVSRSYRTRSGSVWRLGAPNSSLPVSTGKLSRIQTLTLITEVHCRWTRDNSSRLKEGMFQLGPRKKITQGCPWRQPGIGTGYPESCRVFAMEVLKSWLNKALRKPV